VENYPKSEWLAALVCFLSIWIIFAIVRGMDVNFLLSGIIAFFAAMIPAFLVMFIPS